MSFAIIDVIVEMFMNVFGNPYLIAAIVAGTLVLLLMAMKADLTVILMVIVPFMIGIGVNSISSDIINIPTWIVISLFLIMGFIFSGFILYLMR